MQLAQAEAVSVLDDQGVGVGDIQTSFNDGGAHQHLNVPLCHGLHHIPQSILPHLSVGNRHGDSGNPFADGPGALVNGIGAVVQVIDLPPPLHLPADGIVQNGVVVLQHKGLHRIAVGGGFLQGGHIPDAGKRHVQGSGDGGGRQGQHIHTLGHLLQPLLVGNAEALFLVDDEKPKILEGYALLQQLVGTDDEIHIARTQVCQGLLLLLGSAEPAEHIDVHREAPEPGHGGLVVLLSKHRGGHQNGCLLAVHDGLHHRPEGNLRLAEAHIAAEQTIHGHGGFHIPFDLPDAAKLIVGLRVGEVVLKFLLPGGIRGEGVAQLPLSGGVELDQFPCHVLGGLSGLCLGFLPGVAADLVQPDIGILASTADVFAHQIQLGGRDKEGVAALIGDFDIVLHGIVHLDLLHGDKAADAVVFVHHQIPGGQVGEGIQLLAVGCGFFGRGLPLHLASGDELTLRENGQTAQGILHAEGQIPLRQQNLPRLGQGGQGDAQKGGKSLVMQQLLQDFRPAAGAAEYKRPKLLLLVMGQVSGGGFQIAAVARQLLGHHGQQHLGQAALRIGRAAEGIKIDTRLAGNGVEEILPLAHIVAQLPGHQSGLQEAVQLHSHLLGMAPGGAVEVAVVKENHNSVFGDIVGGSGNLWIDEGQIPVGGGKMHAVFQLFQILFQSGDQGLVDSFPAALPGNETADVLA